MIFIFRHYLLSSSAQLIHYARCFHKQGIPVIVFASNYLHNKKERLHKGFFLFRVEDVGGVKIAWINSIILYGSNAGWLRVLNMFEFCLLSFLSAIVLSVRYRLPNLIIGSVAHTPNLFSAYVLARLTFAKYWIEVSELWPEAFISSGIINDSSRLAKVLSALSGFIYKKADFITTISPNSTKQISQKYGVPTNKITTFIPGFSAEFVCSSGVDETRAESLKVVYGGSFGELYPLENIIESINIVRKSGGDICLHLIGGGIRESNLRKKIDDYNLYDCVKIYNYLPRYEYEKILNSADLLLVVERAVGFGFPSKLLDYFNFRRPILMCLDEFYDNIHIPITQVKNNPDDIAVELRSFLSMSKSNIHQIGRDTFCYASSNFDVYSQFMRNVWPHYTSADGA